MNLQRIRWLAKLQAKSAIEQHPALFLALQRLKHCRSDFRDRIVSPGSPICIEGFYRSANSFAVRCFRAANDVEDCSPKIATHVHSSAHVRAALKLGIPTLVLIRPPRATVVSTKAWMIQLEKISNAQNYPLEFLLRSYIQFYSDLLPLRERFVAATFDEVTEDFGKIIEHVNDRFKAEFKLFNHSHLNVQQIFDSSKVHLSPSAERDAIKQSIYEELESIEMNETYRVACDIYDRFLTD